MIDLPTTRPTPARVRGDIQRETPATVSQFSPAPSPAGSFVILCQMCGDVKDENGYRPLADYEGEVLRADLNVSISHGICPICTALYRTQSLQLKTTTLQQKETK